MRNSVQGFWFLHCGDSVEEPDWLVVLLSCGGGGCECQSQPTGPPIDSGTSSPGQGYQFGIADPVVTYPHYWHKPLLHSCERNPAGSQCLPKAGSHSASALCGQLAGWASAPLGQFLPQLISSLWPMPGKDSSLAEQAACGVSARQAYFHRFPISLESLLGGTVPHRVLLGVCRVLLLLVQ